MRHGKEKTATVGRRASNRFRRERSARCAPVAWEGQLRAGGGGTVLRLVPLVGSRLRGLAYLTISHAMGTRRTAGWGAAEVVTSNASGPVSKTYPTFHPTRQTSPVAPAF
jgi:hypothetical protein